MSARLMTAEARRVRRFLTLRGQVGASADEIAKACRVLDVAAVVAKLVSAGEPINSAPEHFYYADGFRSGERHYLFKEAPQWDMVPRFNVMPGSALALGRGHRKGVHDNTA